jgi:hypothetical protein
VPTHDADPSWAPAFAALKGNQVYSLRSFPTPGQYWALVAELGRRRNSGDQAALIALAQRDWHVRGQTGCMFARLAARDAGILRWDYVVSEYAGRSMSGALEIGAQVDRAAEDTEIQVVSIILPGVRDARTAVSAIRELAASTPFWLAKDTVEQGYLHLHLRYPVGAGTGRPAEAWVMAFAPFHFVPNTRRAPYFELAVRVKEKPVRIFRRLNQDRSVAHLADVELEMPERHWEDRWRSTLRRTRMILGGEPDAISAAKSTLAVPESLL